MTLEDETSRVTETSEKLNFTSFSRSSLESFIFSSKPIFFRPNSEFPRFPMFLNRTQRGTKLIFRKKVEGRNLPGRGVLTASDPKARSDRLTSRSPQPPCARVGEEVPMAGLGNAFSEGGGVVPAGRKRWERTHAYKKN
ncbi:hypothetical protein TNCT_644761 [Trichonephila clavata]|uniref:Uncharacterized protein n=1 Tax=Trichonephila clavata TaxID=2740835 RepID=A0A8X6HUZ3_TRICU|nr:hypothetical protein TNCT_644761 [Trichonephila clavata]